MYTKVHQLYFSFPKIPVLLLSGSSFIFCFIIIVAVINIITIPSADFRLAFSGFPEWWGRLRFGILLRWRRCWLLCCCFCRVQSALPCLVFICLKKFSSLTPEVLTHCLFRMVAEFPHSFEFPRIPSAIVFFFFPLWLGKTSCYFNFLKFVLYLSVRIILLLSPTPGFLCVTTVLAILELVLIDQADI